MVVVTVGGGGGRWNVPRRGINQGVSELDIQSNTLTNTPLFLQRLEGMPPKHACTHSYKHTHTLFHSQTPSLSVSLSPSVSHTHYYTHMCLTPTPHPYATFKAGSLPRSHSLSRSLSLAPSAAARQCNGSKHFPDQVD